MCERSPLFLIEAKSILCDLLQRTLELLDLWFHLVEYDRFDKYLVEHEQDYDAVYKSCQINHNVMNDIDTYLQRLNRSCRLTKSNLRSLHAARMMKSSNDYIVIDDEIVESIRSFQLKISQQLPSIRKQMDKPDDHILTLFRKISQLYKIIINELYGVHSVQESHLLQPMVIHIIRLLLLITNKLKLNIEYHSNESSMRETNYINNVLF